MKRRSPEKKKTDLTFQVENGYNTYPRATTEMSTVRRPTIQHTPLPSLIADSRPMAENCSPLKSLIESNIRKLSTISGPLSHAKNRILFREQQKSELRQRILRGDFMNGAHDHILTGEFKTTLSQWNLRKWQLLFFISSNFQDSIHERFFLHQFVIPKLRQYAWAYDIEVICIDMKVGLVDDHDIHHLLWNDSSKEIDKCRNNSSGLFFLSLQNEYYGYRPLPSQIEKRNFEDRIAACSQEEIRELAKDWYLLDTSADPPCYRLKPLDDDSLTARSDSSIDSSTYFSSPSSIWCYFYDEVVPHLRLLFLDLRFDKYLCRDVAVGKSFVEWETKYAFKNDEDLHRILWFPRQITDDHSDLTFRNQPNDEVVSKLHSDLREFMTKRLSKLLIPDIIIPFETKYLSLMTQGSGSLHYENLWKDLSYRRLKSELEMIIQTKAQWELDGNHLHYSGNILREFLYHCHLAHDSCKHCYQRELLLKQAIDLTKEPNRRVHDPRDVIAKKALRNEEKKKSGGGSGGDTGRGTGRYNCISFVVIGDRATGKSSFLAQLGNLLYELEQIHRGDSQSSSSSPSPSSTKKPRPLLIRFCGTTVNSSHGMNLCSSLRHQIEYLLGPYPSSKGRTDIEILRELLAYHAVIVVLDGIDQLTDTEPLRFLMDLNPNTDTRIILSTVSTHPIIQLIQREAIPTLQLSSVVDTPQPKLLMPLTPPPAPIDSPSPKPTTAAARPASVKASGRHGQAAAASPKSLAPIRYNLQGPARNPTLKPQLSSATSISTTASVSSSSSSLSSPSSISSSLSSPSVSTSSSLNHSPLKAKLNPSNSTPELFLESKELLYYLLKHKKRLTDQQWQDVLSQIPPNSTVLYFRILSSLLESLTTLPMTIIPFEKDISGLFNQFLSLIETTDCDSKAACVLSLSYLSISSYGIKDTEMDDLLSLDHNIISSFFPSLSLSTSTPSPSPSSVSSTSSSSSELIIRVPSKIWSKIKRKLKYFLRENVTGCNLWTNELLTEIAKQRYHSTEQITHQLHLMLAHYYANMLPYSLRIQRNIPAMTLLLTGREVWDEKSAVNYRRCEESVSHLLHANQLQEAIDEICSLEYLCCCVRCDLLEKVIFHFEVIQKILTQQPPQTQHAVGEATSASAAASSRNSCSNNSENVKRVNDYHSWLKRSYQKLKLYSHPLISITITAEAETSIARNDFIQLSQQDRYMNFNKFQTPEGSLTSTWIRGYSFLVREERSSMSPPHQLIRLPSSEEDSYGLNNSSNSNSNSNNNSIGASSINCVCWSPDCAYLASASDDYKIRIWYLSSFSLIHTLCGHDQPVTSIAYNPNGLQLISGSRDHKLCLWDTQHGKLVRVFPNEHTLDITTVVWNPLYSEIATGSKDSKVILWNYESQESKVISLSSSSNGGPSHGPSHAFTGDATSGSGSGSGILGSGNGSIGGGLLTSHGNLSTVTLKKYDDYFINHLCYSPDGIELAVANFSTTVRIWNLVERKSRVFTGHRQQVCSIDWNPKAENLIASASDDGTVQIWNCYQVSCIYTIFRQHNGRAVKTVNWCPNGEIIVSSDINGMILIWNGKGTKNEILSCLYGHFDVISSIKWSNDSRYLLSGSKDGNMIVWDSVSI
jgi:WD40 repeat protein